ncbi:hypothetical protein L9F63_017222, partial [Diploptera punctata]
NVVMVTTNEGAPSSSDPESGTALSKLRQTLSSSLMTAQDKVHSTRIRMVVYHDATLAPCNHSSHGP